MVFLHNIGGDPTLKQLTEEFEKTFGDLEEKSRRISDARAEALAKKMDCPVEVARIAIQIGEDLLIDADTACKLLLKEYNRLNAMGYGIPPVLTYEINFAVLEGRWIEFLYSKLSRQLEEKTREISNFESALRDTDVKAMPKEQVLEFLSLRRNISEKLLKPVMLKWLDEHVDSSPLEMGAAFAAAILRTTYDKVIDKLEKGRLSALEIYDFLWDVVKDTSIESTAIENARVEIDKMRKELQKKIDDLGIEGFAEVIIQVAPKKKVAVSQDSKYIFVHTPLSRKGMVGPELVTPTDFLERDILLSKRRQEPERSELLRNTISSVLKALMAKNIDEIQATVQMLTEMQKRFNIPTKGDAELTKELKESVKSIVGLDRLNWLKQYIYDNIMHNIIGGQEEEKGITL
ncbi:MAG: hypothetical protein ACTSW4_03255 [Candidatus Ranarchaeia archaeon]